MKDFPWEKVKIITNSNTTATMCLKEAIDSLQDCVAEFIKDRNGKGRETAVKGTALDNLANLIEKYIKSLDHSDKLVVLKGRKACVPGFFRPSKNWDIVVKQKISNRIMAAIELKSLTRSHGNNYNNRVEECLGNAIDLQTYYKSREEKAPFIGFLLLMNDDVDTKKKRVHARCSIPTFHNTGYLERARILCDNLNKQKIYDSAELITYTKTENATIVDCSGFESFLKKLSKFKA